MLLIPHFINLRKEDISHLLPNFYLILFLSTIVSIMIADNHKKKRKMTPAAYDLDVL